MAVNALAQRQTQALVYFRGYRTAIRRQFSVIDVDLCRAELEGRVTSATYQIDRRRCSRTVIPWQAKADACRQRASAGGIRFCIDVGPNSVSSVADNLRGDHEVEANRSDSRPPTSDTLQPASLTELRRYVQQVVCDRGELLPGAFQFDEQVLRRQGMPCGLHFSLNGPRSVCYSAIWDAGRGTILFYDCTGERFQRCDIADGTRLLRELTVFAGGSGSTISQSAMC